MKSGFKTRQADPRVLAVNHYATLPFIEYFLYVSYRNWFYPLCRTQSWTNFKVSSWEVAWYKRKTLAMGPEMQSWVLPSSLSQLRDLKLSLYFPELPILSHIVTHLKKQRHAGVNQRAPVGWKWPWRELPASQSWPAPPGSKGWIFALACNPLNHYSRWAPL